MSLYQYLKPTVINLREVYSASRRIYEELLPKIYDYSKRCPSLFTAQRMEDINQWILNLDKEAIKTFLKENELEYERSFFTAGKFSRNTRTGAEL